MRKASALLQAAVGLAIVVAVVLLLNSLNSRNEQNRLPQGWGLYRPPNEVSTLALVDGVVWTGGKGGLVLVDTASMSRVDAPGDAPAFGYVHALLADHDGSVWVGHDAGIAKYNSGNWTDMRMPDGSGPGRGLALAEIEPGLIWAGTDGGLLVFEDEVFRPIVLPGDIEIASGDNIFVDGKGCIWVGCASPAHGGLFMFDGSSWNDLSAEAQLPHPSVNMVAEDTEGTIYVATGFADNGGMSILADGKWTTLLKTDGLAGHKARSLYFDHLGRLWVGSEYDGIAIRQDGQWQVISPDEGLAGQEVKAVIQDDSGTFWLGTNTGLTSIPEY